MSDLYVGIVENTVNTQQILAVAIAVTVPKALELTERWIEEKGSPEVRYQIRICEIEPEWIHIPIEGTEAIKAVLGQIRL